MKYQPFRTDVNYQLGFKHPWFELPTVALKVFDALYSAIHPRFAISMADMQSLGGTSLADVMVRLNLFSGLGAIEITPDKFAATAQQVKSEEDLTAVLDCIKLARDALPSVFTSLEASGYTVRATSWLRCEGGGDAVDALLNDHAGAAIPLKPSEVEAEQAKHDLRPQFQNSAEGWHAEFVLERSTLAQADLFYLVNMVYLPDGKYTTIDLQADHTRKLYEKVLSAFGFTAESTS